jgi:hypothetical protein
MTVYGIVTLVRGRFPLTRNRVVTGGPAYLIGVLLTATLPALLVMGMVIGFVATVRAGGAPPNPLEFAFLDFLAVPLILLAVMIVAWTAPKDRPEEQVPVAADPLAPFGEALPPASDNPYASPYTDSLNPPRRPPS